MPTRISRSLVALRLVANAAAMEAPHTDSDRWLTSAEHPALQHDPTHVDMFVLFMEDNWKLDNPAGRLHTLLIAFDRNAHGQTIDVVWGALLGVPNQPEKLPGSLGELQVLVTEIETAVHDTSGDKKQTDRYKAQWRRTIYPHDVALNDQANKIRPSAEALDALEAIAEHLHDRHPDGRVPSTEQLRTLRDDVDTLIQDVLSEDLPDEVNQAIVKRLRQVQLAFDHIAVGGPAAARAAMEAVMGAIVLGGEKAWYMPSAGKVAAFVLTTINLFGVPGTVAAALPEWKAVAHELPAIVHHIEGSSTGHIDRDSAKTTSAEAASGPK